MNTSKEKAQDEFLAKWCSVMGSERAKMTFKADLDDLIQEVRNEERKATLSDGDAMREASRSPR